MQGNGNYYLISHLVLATGLSDRTIRNYISSGILQGEKIDGLWHFTPEQVEEFIRHPAVRPSILSRNNSLVYDFLLNDRKNEPEACVILDFPEADRKTLAEFFCCRINEGNFRNVRFSYNGVGKTPRVILKGNAGEVLGLVNAYCENNGKLSRAARKAFPCRGDSEA